jgi:hypothetical protein
MIEGTTSIDAPLEGEGAMKPIQSTGVLPAGGDGMRPRRAVILVRSPPYEAHSHRPQPGLDNAALEASASDLAAS